MEQWNSGYGGLEGLQAQRTRGIVGRGDQWNSGYRGTGGTVGTEEQEEQWVQSNSEKVGSEEKRNNGYRGPEEQWVQRTRGIVCTEDQWNSGYRGQEEQ